MRPEGFTPLTDWSRESPWIDCFYIECSFIACMRSHCRVRLNSILQEPLWDTLRERCGRREYFVGFSSAFQDWLTLKPGAEGKSVIPTSSEFQISGLLPVSSEDTAFSSFQYCCMHTNSFQSCPTLWDPMDYSPPGSSVHGILQTRILEWDASRGSSWPRDWTPVSCGSCTAGRFFTAESWRKPLGTVITIKKNLSLGIYVSFFLSSSSFFYFHGKIILFIVSIIQQWLVLMMCSGRLSSMFFSLYLLCLALPETSGFSLRAVHLSLPLKGFDNPYSHLAPCRPHSRWTCSGQRNPLWKTFQIVWTGHEGLKIWDKQESEIAPVSGWQERMASRR